MATEPSTRRSAERDGELEALRARLDALEREMAERTARANMALAVAQDRSYWLERWGVDLNALMRRRGANEFRAALRAMRSVYRFLYDARVRARGVPHRLRGVGQRLQAARDELAEERAEAQAIHEAHWRREISPAPLRASPITDLLYQRLGEEDARAVESRLEAPEAALWEAAGETDRRRLTLAFAAHHGVQPALEKSGLTAAMPPPHVHSMARASAAAGGSTYYADLVVDALGTAGFELEPGCSGLDFGCSSARVVRVLAAALPELDWHGCDPIPDAIEWAREHLPGISFERSPEDPPLPYSDHAFDFAFAISIWSHFSERAALGWLAEMRRVIRPGGRLVLTCHGYQSIAHTFAAGVRSAAQLDEISAALYERGFWYAPEFGVQGDHGVIHPDWGTAFLTPEWLLARLTPDWRLGLFAPGRVEDNQDLYVLERR
jgi:SAM-dependent methyltransferase